MSFNNIRFYQLNASPVNKVAMLIAKFFLQTFELLKEILSITVQKGWYMDPFWTANVCPRPMWSSWISCQWKSPLHSIGLQSEIRLPFCIVMVAEKIEKKPPIFTLFVNCKSFFYHTLVFVWESRGPSVCTVMPNECCTLTALIK